VSALGSEYVAPPYATRRADLQEESINYRLVGAFAGTTLAYSPAVPGAPTTLGLGQIAEFQATGAFTITSQDDMHPFYVGQYMSGCSVTSGSRPGANDPMLGNCLGDEEYVNILPPAQWLSSYVFFTDPTYTTTNLVIWERWIPGRHHRLPHDRLATGGDLGPTRSPTWISKISVGSCTDGRHSARSAARSASWCGRRRRVVVRVSSRRQRWKDQSGRRDPVAPFRSFARNAAQSALTAIAAFCLHQN
jgi:hypothetical protein